MIRHIVAMRRRAETSDDTLDQIYRDLAALNGHIGGILDFRHFRNVSVEAPVVHGFKDLFWFDFRDEAVRDAYLEHPAHKAVGARIVAACEGGPAGLLVMDVQI